VNVLCRRLSTLCALIVLVLPSTGTAARSFRADQAGLLPVTQPPCPAETARNSTLGVALSLPSGWQEVSPALFPAVFTPDALFLVIPTGEGNPRLLITGLGTTTDTDEARAANVAADRLLHGIALPVTRQPIILAGARGVLLRGLPAQTPTVQFVIAHAGAIYRIIAFGDTRLQVDQQQALSSLRFVPRVGPFPSAAPLGTHPRVTAPTLALTVTGIGGGVALAVRAAGRGYRPDEVIELDTCWQGVPRSGLRPRYTYYTLVRIARAGRDGILDAALIIPVRPRVYTSYTLRAVARDSCVGYHLATGTRSRLATSPASRMAGRRGRQTRSMRTPTPRTPTLTTTAWPNQGSMPTGITAGRGRAG